MPNNLDSIASQKLDTASIDLVKNDLGPQSIIKKVCRGDDKKMVAIAAASKQLNLINIFFDIYLQCGAAFVWNKDINTNQNISNYSLTFLGKAKTPALTFLGKAKTPALTF